MTRPLYQPRIHDDNVRGLYALKVKTGLPMTRLLNDILAAFLENADASPAEIGRGATSDLEPTAPRLAAASGSDLQAMIRGGN